MEHYKLRIKDPSGAEFEAEGPAEFIQAEKASFLKDISPVKAAPERSVRTSSGQETPNTDFWGRFAEPKGELLKLRTKSPEINAAEAALILMAANEAINQKESTSALALSKSLKASGYAPDRLDRLLSGEIREGRATASGTKRSRTYQITRKGLEKAHKAANKTVPGD